MNLKELQSYVDERSPEELIILQRILNGPDCNKKMEKVGGSYGSPEVMSEKDFEETEEEEEEEEE